MKVHTQVCTPNVELLTLSVRPFYLPREFPTIVLSCVYVPPDANPRAAAETIASHTQPMQSRYPDAPVFIMGDFNKCRLSDVLPSFHQYVDVPTRNLKTIDLCYGTIDAAYSARAHPALGRADHNVISLTPAYRQALKRSKPVRVQVRQWTAESVARLQGSFACTDWDTLAPETESIDDRVSVITDYINFCIENEIKSKTVKVFPNSKPWFSQDIGRSLKDKQAAFLLDDKHALKQANCQLQTDIKLAKQQYKDKVEAEFKNMNTKQAFNHLKNMAGTNTKQSTTPPDDPLTFATQLNTFYNRFNTHDFSTACTDLLAEDEAPQPGDIPISLESVTNTLKQTKACKAPGPDGVPGRVLRDCALELGPALQPIFQASVDSGTLPALWKSSTVVPVPKISKPSELNHYRPVALTSLIMKCFERIILCKLWPFVSKQLDPLQFAYRFRRGTDDAVACLLHTILKHIDTQGNFVHILFADLSSAFNTIQPHIMIKTLQDMCVPSTLTYWIFSFLSNRSQCVRVGHTLSPYLSSSTGAPQGCVLSPFLYILYTNNCRSTHPNTLFLKFSDDTAIVSLLQDSLSLQHYHSAVQSFSAWCNKNFLQLNVNKTKEMCIDFRRKRENTPQSPPLINGVNVERVSEYKYLGIIIDDKLNFNLHTTSTQKKCQQRLYVIRRLSSFQLQPKYLLLLYRSIIESLLTYCGSCIYPLLSITNRNKLLKITRIASKIIGLPTPSLTKLTEHACLRKALIIERDQDHPLNQLFECLPSGRRFRCIKCNKKKYRDSFIPQGIRLLNKL